MFGLPRIICTADDLDRLFAALPSPANGMTLCVGTYGSRPDNDVPQMARNYASRIHFAHLRGVTRDSLDQRSFFEASHLDSDTDMVRVIRHLLENEHTQGKQIFIRPDHGHLMMSDINRTSNPGYSAIGRMKGLAENSRSCQGDNRIVIANLSGPAALACRSGSFAWRSDRMAKSEV